MNLIRVTKDRVMMGAVNLGTEIGTAPTIAITVGSSKSKSAIYCTCMQEECLMLLA